MPMVYAYQQRVLGKLEAKQEGNWAELAVWILNHWFINRSLLQYMSGSGQCFKKGEHEMYNWIPEGSHKDGEINKASVLLFPGSYLPPW